MIGQSKMYWIAYQTLLIFFVMFNNARKLYEWISLICLAET